MRSFLLFSVLFTLSMSLPTSAQETPKAQAESSTTTEAQAAAPAPSLYFGYNYYHYQMTGQRGASTNIYRFGASTVDLHMLSATWLYSPKWTLVALIPHISNKVETVYEPLLAGGGASLTDTTKGLSDVRLMAVTPVSLESSHLTMVDVGVSLPTGSINEYFTSNLSQRAAYNMQLGSGTPDLILGATVTNTQKQLTSSLRGQATFRGGKNANGYNLGTEFLAKAASIYAVNPYLSGGLVGNYKTRGPVEGRDEKYEKSNNYNGTTAIGDGHQYYHSAQMNWDANVMAKLQSASYKSVSAAVEVGVPFARGAQNKDDVELNIDYYAADSLNASF